MIRNYDVTDPSSLAELRHRISNSIMSGHNKLKISARLLPDELTRRRNPAPPETVFYFEIEEVSFTDVFKVMVTDTVSRHTGWLYCEPQPKLTVVN